MLRRFPCVQPPPFTCISCHMTTESLSGAPLFSNFVQEFPARRTPLVVCVMFFNKGSCCSSVVMCRSLHSNARSQAVTKPPEFGHYSRRKSCSDARWGPGTGSECTGSCDSGSNEDKGCVFLSRYTHLPYAEALWQSSAWSTFSCYNATSDPRWLCVLLRSTSSPFEEATSDVGSKVAVVIKKT